MNKLKGFSIVDLMVGATLGLMLLIAVAGVYLAQKNAYKTNTSQANIQSAENAIAYLILPTVRSAGFCGCGTLLQAVSNLNAGGAAPISSLNSTPSMVKGYDAALGTVIPITQGNAPNSVNPNDWTSGLEPTLVGNVEAVSDVLIVLGATPGSHPVGVTSIAQGNSSLTVQNTAGIATGGFGAISDCLKTSVFKITSMSGTTITHSAGTGALSNATDALVVNFPIGSQFIPLTQTAFFIARDPSGQSALVRATLNSNGTWTIQSMIPGVETMQVLYGIGSNGALSRYVPASGVVNWAQVYTLRLGFLIAGQPGSGIATPTGFSLLGTAITVPADNRLRHVYEMTIQLRNATS